MDAPKPSIVVTENGPYVVYGEAPLVSMRIATDADGESIEWEQTGELPSGAKAALCRCGHSGNAPFCDGTHAKIGFQGTETAPADGFQRNRMLVDGPAYQLVDARPFCVVARFCDAGLNVWEGAETATDGAALDHLKHQAFHCPSGRLVLRDKASGDMIEPELPTRIAATQDPSQGCSGPLWATGGIPIKSHTGREYEVRNRVTLCRCGASRNKPFCDGSHLSIRYDDGSGGASGD